MDENTPSGQAIGDPISATDGDILTYRLHGADADRFAIDAGTGQIKTQRTHNFEQKDSYSVIVHVSVNGDFEVAVDSEARSVSMVAMNSDEVVLTLESAVTSGQTVTLIYTPGTNPIRDMAQNPAAALTNETVPNRTTSR